MKTFIRAIEYWVPTDDGSMLEFGGGVFGAATRFAAATRKLCFGRGEGLPGHAWDSGKPIVLNQLDGSYFRRADAARAEGLTSGIALPIYKGRDLTAVLVIFCGDDDAHAGAIELWGNDPAEGKDLSLVDGYYGTTGDTFEFISRSTSFRRGTGLPGLAWDRNVPVFFEDLGKGSGFLRTDGAVKVGINRGVALPCSTLDGSHYVLAFLSALATPIARRVEIWEAGADGRLLRTGGFSEDEGRLTDGPAASAPITDAFVNGVPVAAEPMIAIPVSPQGRTTAVMALYF